MSVRPLAGLVRRLAGPPPDSDAALVGRVAASCPEALAALVRRHGPMVAGACRRVLGPGPDADDAAQAVWLVLWRKAGTVRPAGRVGPWLHGVAVRTARHVRGRRQRFVPLPDLPDRRPTPDPELAGLIDAELLRLPAPMRAAVLLCEVEGRSLAAAAADLGVPVGTLASRLARGRQRLADNLRRRGVSLSAAALSGWLASEATAELATAPASPAVDTITREVLTMLLFDKVRRIAVGLVLFGGLAAGGAGLGWGRADPPPAAPPAPAVPEAFVGLWGHDPDAVVAAAFALLDDPDRAVPYLAGRLEVLAPDPEQVGRWLADLGVGDQAALQAAAARRRAAVEKLGDRPPDDNSWPPLAAAKQLREVLWLPSVYTRLQKLATDLPPGPGRLAVIRILLPDMGYRPSEGPAGLHEATAVVFNQPQRSSMFDPNRDGGKGLLQLPAEPPPAPHHSSAPATDRAVRVLDRINTPAALAAVRKLAAGHPDDPPAKAARAALARRGK